MKRRNTSIMILLLSLTSCSRCKNSYYKTVSLVKSQPQCNCKLYVENYHTISGISTYLTDSVNFRTFTGTYNDEQDAISFDCRRDSVIVEKSTRDPNYVGGSFIPVKKVVYSLTKLKKEHRQE